MQQTPEPDQKFYNFFLVPRPSSLAPYSGQDSDENGMLSMPGYIGNKIKVVAGGRIELPTRGFSVRCSTN